MKKYITFIVSTTAFMSIFAYTAIQMKPIDIFTIPADELVLPSLETQPISPILAVPEIILPEKELDKLAIQTPTGDTDSIPTYTVVIPKQSVYEDDDDGEYNNSWNYNDDDDDDNDDEREDD